MLSYLLILAFVTVVAYLGRRSGNRVLRKASVIVVAGALVLFAGLRHGGVGADTGTYIRRFDASHSFSEVLGEREPGYHLLSWFARTMSDSYATLLLLIALIVVFCYMSTIVRVVKRYETGVYLFVALGAYTFFFNGARQGIAAAICFLAIPFILDRKLWPYLALVAVACTFHRTALIALPLYWLASPTVDWKRLVALGLSTVVMVAFLGVFVGLAVELLSDKYATYAEVGEGGGELWATFLCAQGILLYYFRKVVPDHDNRYARLLNIYLIGLVPALASTISGVNPSGVLRLHLYFSATSILLWPMVFHQLRMTPLRVNLSFGFLIMTLAFFVMTTSSFSKLTPYRINQELFD